jgi:hypothetical protein
MACDFCGQETGGVSAYLCAYCGGQYCPRHRLPETHDCVFKRSARPPETEHSPAPSWTGARDVVSGRDSFGRRQARHHNKQQQNPQAAKGGNIRHQIADLEVDILVWKTILGIQARM